MRAVATILRHVLLLAVAVAVAIPAMVGTTIEANAQARKQRPNLLDVLRGKPRKVAPRSERRVRQAPRRTTKRTVRRASKRTVKRSVKRAPKRTARRTTKTKKSVRRAAAPATAAPAAPAAVEKHENARVVLVVGDFLAGGIADGFEDAFAESPGIQVIDASNGSSGLVREDYHDWQTTLPALMEEHNPIVVVVQLGANDGQPMRSEAGTFPERSPQWSQEYRARARKLAEAVEATDAELVWVGAPAFKSRSLSNDVLAFNAHFAAAAESAGGAFVDVWEGFVDQNGAYVRSGPDMTGQVVRLRNGDGINLTRAGRRKMAFFAEKEVRRLLGGMDDASFGSIDDIAFAPLGDDLLQAPLQPRMSAPVSLGDAVEAEELASGTSESATQPNVNPGLVVVEPEGVPEGRADNFAWPQS